MRDIHTRFNFVAKTGLRFYGRARLAATLCVAVPVAAQSYPTPPIPVVRARLTDVGYMPLGYMPLGGTPEGYGRIIRSETEKWGKIIHNAGIRAE